MAQNKKLGYTWYPKDWGNSDSVFELTLIERGLYRELIDMAMLNDNKTILNIKLWARKFGSNENEIEQILITLQDLNLIVINNDFLFIPSCEPRLNLSRGGKKSKPNKTSVDNLVKPTSKPLSKPTSKQREKEIEIESEIENKKESKNNIYFKDLISSNEWLEKIAMDNQKKFDLIQVKEKLSIFFNLLENTFDEKQNKKDFATHFVRWLNLQENTKVKPFFDSPA